MGLTCALLLALATAGGAARLDPLPAEPPRAYACRAALIPEGRACTSRCDQALAGAARDDARFECTLACTQRTLHALAACRATPPAEGARSAGAPPPRGTPLAVR